LPVRLFEFEEGYLRPNHVTIECWSNGAKQTAARGPERGGNEIGVAGLFSNRMRQSIAYWLAATLAHPWFPDYRSHRIYPAWLETIYWVRRRWRKPMANRRFFLFPLQLDGDAQIVGRSSFASMANALDHVLESFAVHAPKDTLLLVKRHPFDPDLSDWASQVSEQAGKWGIADRVYYVSRFDLDPLLRRCGGVVTVNSTVGPLALALDKPVHVMGHAIYHRPGLTHDGALDDFWCAPPPPGQSAFAEFTAELKARSQVNGGFHSDTGLELLVANALRILLDDTPR
jgi:capsular polysaccharide export protein